MNPDKLFSGSINFFPIVWYAGCKKDWFKKSQGCSELLKVNLFCLFISVYIIYLSLAGTTSQLLKIIVPVSKPEQRNLEQLQANSQMEIF